MDLHQLASAILNHAIQLTLLAGFVWCVVRLFATNRPHLAHALWILVLIKCVVPPAWSSPTSVFYWINAPTDQSQILSQTRLDTSSTSPARQDNDTSTSHSPDIRLSVAVDDRSELRASSESAVIERPLNPTVSGPWQPFANIPRAAIATGITVLLIGFAVGLLLTCARLLYFLKAAYSKGFYSDTEIDNLVRQLSKRLGVKRIVRVRLVRNPIGPVVLGIFRPTLLLPDLIVRGKKLVELEPLIAHELIHIRRGDLWWSMLQAIATSLWWFHPLVRLAGQMVSRETERSCDEETIASLGCSPAIYARSLLDVLERKHQLQIAPALPGVRPIEVTLDRMERIMKLGQGSHKRAPRWIWAAMFIGCAVALPSGSVGVAQEGGKVDSVAPASAIGPVPKADGDFAKQWQSYREDVGDLIEALKDQGMSNEEAQRWILTQLPFRKPEDASGENSRVNRVMLGGTVNSDLGLSGQLTVDERSPSQRIIIDAEVESDLGLHGKVSVSVPSPRIVDRKLEVSDTVSKIEELKAKLRFLRSTCRKLISCEVKVVSFSKDVFKEVFQNWATVESKPANVPNQIESAVDEDQTESALAPSQMQLAFQLPKSNTYLLNDPESDALTKRKDVHLLAAPRTIGRSGQTIAIDFHPNLIFIEKKFVGQRMCVELQSTLIEGERVRLQAKCLHANVELRFEDLSDTDKPELLNDTGGHGKRVLEALRLEFPNSRISVEATERLMLVKFEQGKIEEAFDIFKDLLATFPESKILTLACEPQLGKTLICCVPTKIDGRDCVLALLVKCSVAESAKTVDSADVVAPSPD